MSKSNSKPHDDPMSHGGCGNMPNKKKHNKEPKGIGEDLYLLTEEQTTYGP
jgi:hypothetical protein